MEIAQQWEGREKQMCIRCGEPTFLRFWCPCDLFHALCEDCKRNPYVLQDCACITAQKATV